MVMPAVKQLINAGYNVLVIDKKPCDDAYKIATKVIEADIFKYEEVEKALVPYQINGIIPVNDFAVRTAAIVSDKRKICGINIQAVENVLSKGLMKQKWEDAGLPTAKFKKYKVADVINAIGFDWNNYPAIVKPSFAGGASRGVFKVGNYEDIKLKVEESLKYYLSDEVLIEEYIEGTEHTVEVLIHDYNTNVISISDKVNYRFSYTVVQKLYFPGSKGNKYRKEIEQLVNRACKSLDLKYGCAHFEIMITNNDRIYLLEVGGRPGGGLNFFPIGYLSTGYNYPVELGRIMTGHKPLLDRHKNTYQLGWYFWEAPDGILKEVRGFENVTKHTSVVIAEMLKKPGDILNSNFRNDMERPGYFLVKGRTKEEVDNLIDNLKGLVTFITE